MTKSHDTIQNILENKGENLNESDVELIRNEYPFLSIEEFEDIGFIEEIISQIQITPRNDEVIEN
tara:strand:+ start:405 stop:599 length:195 start_codon:yes stop_codon:yes gene_type:complete